MVESTTSKEDGILSVERRFFLCSLPAEARRFARAVRTHWQIENSLHWVLDVSFNEDQCRVRSAFAAENLAALRHLALNLLRKDTETKRSIRGRQKDAGWNHTYLLSSPEFNP